MTDTTRSVDVEQLAAELFEKHPGHESIPVQVESMVNLEGLRLVRQAAGWRISSFTHFDGLIGVNSRHSRVRERVAIAHALGHWMMHNDGRKIVVDHAIDVPADDLIAQEEAHANSFALALLMPRGSMEAAVEDRREHPGTREEVITAIADDFKVTAEAAATRLAALGFLRN